MVSTAVRYVVRFAIHLTSTYRENYVAELAEELARIVVERVQDLTSHKMTRRHQAKGDKSHERVQGLTRHKISCGGEGPRCPQWRHRSHLRR